MTKDQIQDLAKEIFEMIENALDSTTRFSDDILQFAGDNEIDLSKVKVDDVTKVLTPMLNEFISESIEMAIELKEFIES